MWKKSILIILFLLSGCSWDDDSKKSIRISGETMGTTYAITVVGAPKNLTAKNMKEKVEETLQKVNAQMSNWDRKSEITLINEYGYLKPQSISSEMLEVLVAAEAIHEQSQGFFDLTVSPLVDLWGFGPKKSEDQVPTPLEIAKALKLVGQKDMYQLNKSNQSITKNVDGISINLSAIAKGYGVDEVSKTLSFLGAERHLVEIGGDLVVSGLNDKDLPWSIGVEKPDAEDRSVKLILPITDLGMATSGDYRNFFESEGIRYSHIIDPTNGRPVSHRTSSVTVLAENAMIADGWATALLVAGVESGLQIAEKNNISALFISNLGDKFTTKSSSAFTKLTKSSNE